MLCPTCGQHVTGPALDRIPGDEAWIARLAAKALGSLGGRTKGQTKARQVDYAAMARLSHQKRAENKANQGK